MVFTVRTHEVVALFLVVCISLLPSALSTAPQVPCFFIFGDSIVDNGNNNRLKTTTKVNYQPYAELLGFKSAIPPFATAKGTNNQSVNYASGSAGIRNETGKQLGQRISMNEQLLHHNVTVSRIARLLGNTPSRKDHLCKCLYYMVVGSNDYINNYFKPEYYSTSKKYSTKEYAAVLTREYSQQLKALIKSLNNHLPDAQFIYVPALELSEHIPVPGIKFLLKPCCEVSKTTGLCVRGKDPCPDRALHLFFDNFHPTSAAYKAAAAGAYAEILRLIQ
ncbi:GDSL esterase/lipase [Sesamum angolense]|uniref:GDSL esterase/lipase n=1 Tax=Sesamum angolense TaxID=2727404 RepID=A0AAE1W9Y1_9LAMI|nr:GDSL esterase/lipase [Sesamum angolense]